MSDIVWLIKPLKEDSQNLKEKMEKFLFEICQSKDIIPKLEVSNLDEAKLNMEQRKAIYLVFKEAVNNVAKYASAKHLTVKLYTKNNQIILKISDDGIGFDTEQSTKGNGISNMQNRANELGGITSISSQKNVGTTLSFEIPF